MACALAGAKVTSEGTLGGSGFIAPEHPANTSTRTSTRHTDDTLTDFPLASFSDELRPWLEVDAMRSWAGVTYNTHYGRNEVWKIAGTVKKLAF